jgi:hypothetical protein
LTRNCGKIESKIPQLRDFSKLRRSFVLTPFSVEMAASESADPQLSDAGTSIRISLRVWKIGDAIYSMGDQAVTKLKMRENFGAQYAQARLEGVIMGRGSTKKVRVKWTNLQDPNEFEYGYNHSIFKDPSAPPRQKAQKIVHQSQIAPSAGVVIPAGSNESDLVELHPASHEVSDAEDEAGIGGGGEGEGGVVAESTRGARQAAKEAQVARADPGDLSHTLFNGRALGLGGSRGEGQCRLCSHKHASGVCKTCSTGLDSDRAKPFWVCYPGSHGRKCYRQHLHHELGQ